MDTGFQLRYVCYLRGNKIIIGEGSMYRKILMRAGLTGGMVVSIATANLVPVFVAEPA